MGDNSKVFFVFDKPVWRKENTFFSLNTDLLSIWDNCETEFGRSPYTLTGFAGGSASQIIAEQSDKEIIGSALTALTAFFPDARKHFIGLERGKQWQQDAFTHGSYTGAYSVGEPMEYAARETPYYDGMYFAGSSWADLENEGFMNGAVKTGQKAAELVVAHSQQGVANRNVSQQKISKKVSGQ